MQPRITVITIGVDDLAASLRFYREVQTSIFSQ